MFQCLKTAKQAGYVKNDSFFFFALLSSVLVRIWSGKNKLSTSFRTTVSSITDGTATVNISPDLAGGEQQSIVVESEICQIQYLDLFRVFKVVQDCIKYCGFNLMILHHTTQRHFTQGHLLNRPEALQKPITSFHSHFPALQAVCLYSFCILIGFSFLL